MKRNFYDFIKTPCPLCHGVLERLKDGSNVFICQGCKTDFEIDDSGKIDLENAIKKGVRHGKGK